MLNKKRICIGIIALLISLFSLNAQEGDAEAVSIEYHMKGDQSFSIELGLVIPMFYLDLSPEDFQDQYTSDANLSLGASFMLNYMGYLDGHWQIGVEGGGMMASSPNENQFYMVPLLFRTAYDININSMFTVPLFLSAGVSLNTYLENFQVAPMVKPGIGLYWHYDSQYTFGLTYTYWFVAELSDDPEYNIIGNFSQVYLCAQFFM